MPKKKGRETPTKQSARFIATAKKLGIEENGNAFERAVSVLLRQGPGKIAKRQSKK